MQFIKCCLLLCRYFFRQIRKSSVNDRQDFCIEYAVHNSLLLSLERYKELCSLDWNAVASKNLRQSGVIFSHANICLELCYQKPRRAWPCTVHTVMPKKIMVLIMLEIAVKNSMQWRHQSIKQTDRISNLREPKISGQLDTIFGGQIRNSME